MSTSSQDTANLRLPVPFFDLLMVLLVTCLVFVAPVKSDGDVQAMDVSISHGNASASPGALLPVTVLHTAAGWTFRATDGGAVMDPKDLAARAATEHRKVALIVPPTTAVQDFVDMQSTLAGLGVPFALAIRNKESAP